MSTFPEDDTQPVEAVASSSTNPPIQTTAPASDPSNPFENLTSEAFFNRTNKRDLLRMTRELYAAYQMRAGFNPPVTTRPSDREIAAELARLEATQRTVPHPPTTLPLYPEDDNDYNDWTRPRRTRSPSPPPGTSLVLSL